jgi:ATP:ADP antiporter, AAA family
LLFYKPLDTPGANWAAATSLTLIAQAVAGKAVRDALFLSNFHAHSLPFAMASAAVLSLAAVLWLSRVMARNSPARILPIVFAVSAVGMVLEWALGFALPRVSACLVYFHTALFGPALLTTFWSLINERFDPHTAKRAVARIAGGGTLGGVLGGIAAWRASTLVPVPTLLLFLAALSALGLLGTLLIRSRRTAIEHSAPEAGGKKEEEPVSAFQELAKAPYLRNLALLVTVSAATSTLLDYLFSAQAELVVARGAPLLNFFSLFWLGVSVLSFVLQVAFGRVALERLGLAWSIAILPAIILLGSALGLAVPGLPSAALLRGGEAVQRNTLFRSAYELLYTPLSEARKRTTKSIIDVGFDRAGTVVGSGVALATLHLIGVHVPAILLGVVVVLALAIFPLARQLHVGYVEALQKSLRDGAEKLALPDDAEPARPTIEARARESLIERVEAISPGGLSALLDGAPPAAGQPAKGPAAHALQGPSHILRRTSELLSGDPARMTRALENLTPRGPSTACAIYLLADKRVHAAALEALRAIGPSIVGQLTDALLDERMDFVVRRRIPRVLAVCPSQRAADGLLLGIADPRFEVRYQCGRALLRITEADDSIVVSRDHVEETIKREIEAEMKALEAVSNEDFDDEIHPDELSSLMEMLARDRVNRSLEHIFTILSLHLEREPLRIAFRALHHEDTRHRGTALEYLETVLPPGVREVIWPYLGEAEPLPTARPAKEILSDLASVSKRPSGA